MKNESSDEFVKLAIPSNSGVSFFGRWMTIHLKADWEAQDNASENLLKTDSLVYVDAEKFLEFSKAKEDGNEDDIREAGSNLEYHLLFEPSSTTSYAGFSATKNYLILYTLNDVKKQMTVFKIGESGGPFALVGTDKEGKIQSISASGVDSKEGDLIWYTTSGYTQPSTLHLADLDKYGEDDFITGKLKSLPQMVSISSLMHSNCILYPR